MTLRSSLPCWLDGVTVMLNNTSWPAEKERKEELSVLAIRDAVEGVDEDRATTWNDWVSRGSRFQWKEMGMVTGCETPSLITS